MRRDAADGLAAVGQLARHVQAPFAAGVHQLQGLDPAGDHAANREFGRLAALVGAVEHGAVDQGAVVVGAHGVFAGRLRPVTADQHFVLQAGRQHGHAFALGIIDQVGLADAGSGFRLGLRFGLHLLANHAEGGRKILAGNPAFDAGEGIGYACQNGIQAHAR
ncbi:hypothetical protein D9M71_445700 [compost metagenome]